MLGVDIAQLKATVESIGRWRSQAVGATTVVEVLAATMEDLAEAMGEGGGGEEMTAMTTRMMKGKTKVQTG